MKASELIQQLQEAVAKYGDLEVYSQADWEYVQSVGLKEWSERPEIVLES